MPGLRARSSLLAAAVLVVCLRGLSAAGVSVLEGHWQFAPKSSRPGRSGKFLDADALRAAGLASGHARVRLSVENADYKPVEGILVRYAFYLKVAPSDSGKTGQAEWAVPFMIDERRIPMLGARQSKDIFVDPVGLLFYITRAKRAGFVAQAVRMGVMVEPRLGQTEALKVVDVEAGIAP